MLLETKLGIYLRSPSSIPHTLDHCAIHREIIDQRKRNSVSQTKITNDRLVDIIVAGTVYAVHSIFIIIMYTVVYIVNALSIHAAVLLRFDQLMSIRIR